MVVNIPRSYQAWDAIDTTPDDFNLDAGLYGLTVSGLAGGTVQLFKYQPDATYAPVTPVVAAAGYATYQLPAGQYRMGLAGVTAFSGTIELISRGPLR